MIGFGGRMLGSLIGRLGTGKGKTNNRKPKRPKKLTKRKRRGKLKNSIKKRIPRRKRFKKDLSKRPRIRPHGDDFGRKRTVPIRKTGFRPVKTDPRERERRRLKKKKFMEGRTTPTKKDKRKSYLTSIPIKNKEGKTIGHGTVRRYGRPPRGGKRRRPSTASRNIRRPKLKRFRRHLDLSLIHI